MALKRNTVANYLGQGWTALMGLAFVPAYIHYLGVEAWGLIGFFGILQAWLTLLDLGLTPTLSREMARFQAGALGAQGIRDLLRSLELILVAIAACVVLSLAMVAPWLAEHWLNASRLPAATVSQAVTAMGLVLAGRMLEQIYRGALQGLQDMVWLNAALAVLATLRWGAVVGVLAWVSPSIEAFFLWQGLVSILAVVVIATRTYRLLPKADRRARFDRDGLLRIRRFAGGMVAITLLALLLTQVDKILLSKLVSLEEFGIYALASSVAAALGFVVAPIASAVQPRLTELVSRDETATLIETYHNASQWLVVMLAPAALVIAIFSHPLLLAWTGLPDLADRAAPILSVLAIGTLFNGLMHVPYAAQIAHGWTGFAVRMNLVAVLVIVPAVLFAVPRYGAIGAAWVWLTLNAGYVLIGIHFMHRRLLCGEKWRWYRDAVLLPLAAGVLSVAVMRAIVVLPSHRLESVLVLALIGGLVLVAVAACAAGPRASIWAWLAAARQPSAG